MMTRSCYLVLGYECGVKCKLSVSTFKLGSVCQTRAVTLATWFWRIKGGHKREWNSRSWLTWLPLFIPRLPPSLTHSGCIMSVYDYCRWFRVSVVLCFSATCTRTLLFTLRIFIFIYVSLELKWASSHSQKPMEEHTAADSRTDPF